MEIRTLSALETQEIGKQIGRFAYDGLVLLLTGDLGAGKTTFTQGLAQGLGIERTISSPTFTIMKNYQGRLELNHIDAYRLENLHQDLGFEERIGTQGVTVIEWPDFIQELWPDSYLQIAFEYVDEFTRNIVLKARGLNEEHLLENLK